jgi:hypothetical protein
LSFFYHRKSGEPPAGFPHTSPRVQTRDNLSEIIPMTAVLGLTNVTNLQRTRQLELILVQFEYLCNDRLAFARTKSDNRGITAIWSMSPGLQSIVSLWFLRSASGYSPSFSVRI